MPPGIRDLGEGPTMKSAAPGGGWLPNPPPHLPNHERNQSNGSTGRTEIGTAVAEATEDQPLQPQPALLARRACAGIDPGRAGRRPGVAAGLPPNDGTEIAK